MNSFDFDEYTKLNSRLLKLILSGEGDSELADMVRDEMDRHWYHLTDAEQLLIRRMNKYDS